MKFSARHFVIFFLGSIFILSCRMEVKPHTKKKIDMVEHKKAFSQTLQKHLDAVSDKDLNSLQSTLSPEGTLFFMLDKRETSMTTQEFLEFHEGWFKSKGWTFETRITDTMVGEKYGIAITEIIYREPDRDGKPYFNRMAVSYALEYIDGQWYIIKDHATSIEKSTDKI